LTVNRAEGITADLVARCQAGDVDAFAELYRQHAPRVFSLTCRMSGSTETGEDLLQEVFLQAHRKIHGFKGDSAVGTWLYRLAINHCLDFVRSRRVKMDKATDSLDRDGATAPGAAHCTLGAIAGTRDSPATAWMPRAFPVLHDVENTAPGDPRRCWASPGASNHRCSRRV
jgi:RNA polymerase sigma-70 factor (ECF subfamily)